MGTPKAGARVSVRRIGFGLNVIYLACPNLHNDLVAQAHLFCIVYPTDSIIVFVCLLACFGMERA